ncbi:MAG: C10 family peptidase [Kiritimatiellae bacterium]|nr:C10 family peptidase [Kiritimatiellia bacterium]
MKKTLPSIAVALAMAALPAVARDISSDEAGRAAAAWARRDSAPLGTALSSADVAEVRTASDDAGPIFYVVSMAGGGVIVTSAESGVTPIVAFLDGDGIDESPGNPLWEILNADMAFRTRQVRAVRNAAGAASGKKAASAANASDSPFAAEEAAWAKLLAEPAKKPSAKLGANISDASGISDLRVAPLVSTTWGQRNNAANYYTPPYEAGNSANYPCGCVALAGAQIANYWRFPTESCPQVDRACYVNGVQQTYRTMGGTYDWANMPSNYSSLSAIKKKAVGRLCYDFGVATQMDWGPSGSSTVSTLLDKAFRDVFRYSNAMSYCTLTANVIPNDLVGKAVLANLDARCPVAIGIAGHEAVADGYGYSGGTLYTHVNLGWNGTGNAWYNLPEIKVNESGISYTSSILNTVVYNIFPTETGELLTGRVLNGNGAPVCGATVMAANGTDVVTGTSDERGIYALRVTGGRTWTLSATHGLTDGSSSAYVATSFPAVGERTSDGATIEDAGRIGNSWGNDITLGVDVSAPAFEDALDAPLLAFTTGGAAEWFVESPTTHDGEDAAQSGPVTHDQSSWLETTVTGPGKISFWWSVSSESDWDWLEFYIDGTRKSHISGTGGGWAQKTVEVSGGGVHTLRWQYKKDESNSDGADCGWIDQVVWTPTGDPQPAGGYVAWATSNNLGASDTVTEGVPNLIRYVFNRPSGACNPFTGIGFLDGKPALQMLPFKNTDGVTIRVISTTNLTDWSHAEVFSVPLASGNIIFNHGEPSPSRFYKLWVEE